MILNRPSPPRFAGSTFNKVHDAACNGPLFIVLNASSGKHDAAQEQTLMEKVFNQARREVEFLHITDPAQIGETAGRAVDRAQERHGVVVAAGGDGTINAVAAAVLGSGCPFGVLPQGTFNYFGRANAIPQETEAAARALLGASISPVQVGLLNGRLFLVNASLGLYPQLLEDREAWKQKLGRSRLVAFISGLATLIQSRSQLDLQIELAGQDISMRSPTLFVGNNNLQLARVGIDDAKVDALQQGLLTGIALRPMGTLALFGLLIRGLIGRLGEAENIDTFSFRRLTVTPKHLKRIKVATDGEICWMNTPLVFEVAEEPLLLLVPAAADRAEIA